MTGSWAPRGLIGAADEPMSDIKVKPEYFGLFAVFLVFFSPFSFLFSPLLFIFDCRVANPTQPYKETVHRPRTS